jgi:hypothetical protein
MGRPKKEDTKMMDEPKEQAKEAPAVPKKYKIMVNTGPDGAGDVVVGNNGKTWRIKRDVEVIVPQECINAGYFLYLGACINAAPGL